MSISNLNEDCLLLILDYLNLDDLMNVLQINRKFSALAIDEYDRKYSPKMVEVGNIFKYPDELNEVFNVADTKIDADTIERVNRDLLQRPRKMLDMSEDPYKLNLFDYETILNVFKYFGNQIKWITTRSYPWNVAWQTQLVGHLISEYSSESLVQVCPFDRLLEHITKPLINVENVTFFGEMAQFPTINFCELFPAVRRLELRSSSDKFRAYIGCHMPHLEHALLEPIKNSSHLLDFVIKNPQIQSIALISIEPEFIQNVSTLLPQLGTLLISKFTLENASIQFENVIAFDTGYGSLTSPANLHFPRLRALVTAGTNERFDEYLAFVNEHNHLTHLHLKQFKLGGLHFQQLTANLNDLVEVTLEYDIGAVRTQLIESNAVVEFLRSHPTVSKLIIISHSKLWKDELQAQLEYNWTSEIIQNGLSFERYLDNRL